MVCIDCDPTSFADLGLPAPVEHPTQGDLILVAAPGVQVAQHLTPEAAAAAPRHRATHGHDPALPALGAGFVMGGPGVREHATLDDVSMVDVAPTAARLLGIDLPGAEGRALAEALTSEPPLKGSVP